MTRQITLDLLRKRSEHNEGLVSSLEELALHQEDLQCIGPILGRTCGKTLRILLLQVRLMLACPRSTRPWSFDVPSSHPLTATMTATTKSRHTEQCDRADGSFTPQAV